jgi:hypothetical protein
MIYDSIIVTGSAQVSGSLSVTGGITGSLQGTASFATTASYVANASSFPFTGSAIITGSLGVTGSLTTTGIIQAGNYIFGTGGNDGSRLSNNGTLDLQYSVTGSNSYGLSIGRATNNGTAIILRRGAFYATAIGIEGSAGSNNNSGVTTFSYYYQANPASGINDGDFIELMRLNPPGVGNATLDVSGSARFEGNTTVTGSLNVTNGITGSLQGTSSYALTASFVANASSFPFTGSAIITGSLVVTGSTTSTGGFTGSLFGTASFAATASYIQALGTYVTASRTLTINGESYDLTADRSWTIPLSGSVRNIQKFTATSGQTSFTISGGYVTGLVDVYINGVKLDNSGDFTATNGTTVVLTVGAMLNDIVEVYNYVSAFTANNTLRVVTPFTATAAQTTFTVAYTPGFVDVFYNGSKLAASEFTATNGTTIVLGTAAQLNDIIEVIAYSYTVGAFTGIGGSGTANYVAKFISGSTIATSSIYDSGSNVGINTINPIYTLDVSGSARFTNTATITGSLNVSGSNTLIGTKTITGSVFISGSKTIIGTNTITGSLNVSGSITSTGTLTAQTLVVQTITSSVLYSSGSNIFGNSLSNTQIMTGSVGITGSLTLNNIAIPTSASLASTYLQLAGGTLTGALGGTTAGFSGTITSLGSGASTPALTNSGAGTNLIYGFYNNTSGGLLWGVESSAGADIFVGTSAYSGVLGTNGSKSLHFATNNTTRLTITSGGNVGIGTTIPSGIINGKGLVIYDTDYPRLILQNSTTGTGTGAYSGLFMVGNDLFLNTISTGKLSLGTSAGSDILNITSGGNVGIGTTSPNYANLVISNAAVNSGNNSALAIGRATSLPSSAADYGNIFLFSTDAYAADKGGTISFGSQYGSSGGETRMSGIFGGKENATNGDYSGYLSFYTRLSGNQPAERMRITSGGIATVNSYAAITGGTFDVPASTTKTVTVAFNAGNIHAFLGFSSQSGGITGAGSKSIFLGGTTNDGSGHTPTVISTFSYGDQVVGAATTNTSTGFTFTITNNKAAIVSWTWSAFGSYGSITVT